MENLFYTTYLTNINSFKPYAVGAGFSKSDFIDLPSVYEST